MLDLSSVLSGYLLEESSSVLSGLVLDSSSVLSGLVLDAIEVIGDVLDAIDVIGNFLLGCRDVAGSCSKAKVLSLDADARVEGIVEMLDIRLELCVAIEKKVKRCKAAN